jgi:PAS domain S-box-containing protein
MDSLPEPATDLAALRRLLDDYLRMYASRDDRLTTLFSDDFSGFTGGGDVLIKNRDEWVAITRQDFAQVTDAIRIELKDLTIQSLADSIAVATSFFTIHLPMEDQILSREIARLVLIFRKELAGWKITHSSISIPYPLVRDGEIYPLTELADRNQLLEELVAERTIQLSAANANLRDTNERLVREIDARKQAECALQRSEDRYRSILHASPDDITITDLEGRILMISPAAFSIFAVEPAEGYLGRPITEYIVPEDRARARAQIAQKLQGVKTGPTEYGGLRRDGSIFDIEVNSEFIRDAEGTATGMVVIVRDITTRKRVEAEREALEIQNRQLQKAESLGRMGGAIAHHFNNQLQTVMMTLELAAFEVEGRSEAVESLTTAMQATRKAAEMSRLMLTYLGQTGTEPKRIDLSEVCRQGLALLHSIIPKQAILQSTLPTPGPTILADPNQIRHVLANLVTNAWEAGGEEGNTIHVMVKTVPAAEIPEARRFPIDCHLQDTIYACLEVADSGCGISSPDIEKIFDPFYSSKFPGRGMGLAVALGIVRAHDGAITVESKPGRGSAFRVFLPVVVDRCTPEHS